MKLTNRYDAQPWLRQVRGVRPEYSITGPPVRQYQRGAAFRTENVRPQKERMYYLVAFGSEGGLTISLFVSVSAVCPEGAAIIRLPGYGHMTKTAGFCSHTARTLT
jgi:hypothetical protein